MARGRLVACALGAVCCLVCWHQVTLAEGMWAFAGLSTHRAPASLKVHFLGARSAGHAAAAAATSSSVNGARPLTASTLLAFAAILAVSWRRDQRLSRASRVACAGKKRGGGGGGGDGGDVAEGEEIDTEALLKDYESKMDKALEVLRENLMGIRAGKATPALLSSIKVNAYDSQVSINEVATVTITDSKTLTLTCFDEAVAPNVEKAVLVSNLGYTATASGASVKVLIPELTQDKRKEYAKVAKDSTEKARVAIRNVRQAAMKKVKGLNKKLSEDVSKSLQKEVEDLTKKMIGSTDKMLKEKEKEILKG